ncbi:MAG: CHAT domain-containing protein [Bacteroidetes bacterium]|nr:CHAT domain-containing protein [Bacteroidota bacterium]
MTEAEKLEFMETFEIEIKNFFTSISNHVQKHPELIEVLLNYRIQTKSMLLNNLSKIKKSIAQLNDPLINEKFEKMKLNRENISKLMSLNTDEYTAALSEVDALKKEADQIEKEISARVSQKNFSGYQKLTWKDIQKQLLPNECAIEIVRTNQIYINDSAGTNYSFIILKSTGYPVMLMMDRPITWEEEVLSLYRKSINDRKDEPDLYRRLWKGIKEKAGTATTVYLSSDGIYNQVNLNTLYNSETKKYLIEEINIHGLSSLRDINELKIKPLHIPSNVALIGNPVFNYDLSKLPENKKNFGNDLAVRGGFGFVLDQLPGTKTEIETIKTQLEKGSVNTTALTEEKANESNVKKIKNPDVLHFATHGFFLEDLPEATLAQLSKTERSFYGNPMMRSGVFLSGANNTYSLNTINIDHIADFEDGTLTAYEVMNLDLDKTELVVLSACETGLGKVKNGEGVFGLQRAFKLAGAKSVIMSLWSVSDAATMELMINFYKRWMNTGDLYGSFKEAQLDVKKKYPEPYYWGAFVLNGR